LAVRLYSLYNQKMLLYKIYYDQSRRHLTKLVDQTKEERADVQADNIEAVDCIGNRTESQMAQANVDQIIRVEVENTDDHSNSHQKPDQ
jgi:hypothetical protein